MLRGGGGAGWWEGQRAGAYLILERQKLLVVRDLLRQWGRGLSLLWGEMRARP